MFTENIAAQWRVKDLELNDLNSLQLDGQDIGEDMVKYTIASKQAVWMFALFWSLSFFWIFLRCIFNVDFQVVRTTIHIYPKDIFVLYKNDKNQVKSSDTSSSDSEGVDLAPNKSLVRFRSSKLSPTTTRKSKNSSVPERHNASTSVKNLSVVSPESLEIHKKTTDVISDSTTQPSNTAYQETNGPDDVIVDLDKDTWMANSSNKQKNVSK
uniref:Uncharacterized protein n=1 Tax=Cuerna arida TaxID=1464854 RepID=A0A1B6GYS3_9HEMI